MSRQGAATRELGLRHTGAETGIRQREPRTGTPTKATGIPAHRYPCVIGTREQGQRGTEAWREPG